MIDLKQFCGTKEQDATRKAKISTPFSQNSFTYATDGCIIIRIPRSVADFTRDDCPKNVATLLDVPDGWSEYQALPAKPVPQFYECEKCCGSGKANKCRECNGAGYIECNLGHDHECENCGGVGFIQTVQDDESCESCGGKGELRRYSIVNIKSQNISEKYLDMLYVLPNCKIAENKTNPLGVLSFIFDGGDGLLMPVRVN